MKEAEQQQQQQQQQQDAKMANAKEDAVKVTEEQKQQQEADLEKRAGEMLEALEGDASPDQKRARLREALRQEWGGPTGTAWADTQAR